MKKHIKVVVASAIVVAAMDACNGGSSSSSSPAPSPVQQYAYITNNDSNTVSMYSIESGVLTPLSPESTVAAGNGPYGIVLDPSGIYAYITNNISSSNTIYSDWNSS